MPERDPSVERRQLPGDRPQERRLAGAVRPDDADPLPRWAARNGTRATVRGSPDRLARRRHLDRVVGRQRDPPRQVADDEVVDPEGQLARADRSAAGERRRRERQATPRPGRLDPARLEPLEAGLVLVHLAELAMAPVALDELAFAGDRVGRALGLLRRSSVALLALPVVGAVVAPEDRQPPVPELPDPGHRRVEEGSIVGRDEERTGPSPKVRLEPLERPEVEVVRRLVEQEQVGIRDDEPGQRRPGLLATRQRGRRPAPLAPRESEPGQRLFDAEVERVATEDIEARPEHRRTPARRRDRRPPSSRARPPSARGARPHGGQPSGGPAPP